MAHAGPAAKVFEAKAVYAENDWRSLLGRSGHKPYRYTVPMTRPNLGVIRDLPLPAGSEVRPVEQEHLLPILEAEREALREQADFNEEAWTEEGLKAFCGKPCFQPDLWRVAWHGDGPVGGVIAWVDCEENEKYGRDWGYTQCVFVARRWRKRGLSSTLITQAMKVVRDHGATEAALTADADNPHGAVRLYHSLGYRVYKRFASYRKPVD